ncbi:hypothetical protein [Sphingopyxis sp. UBA6734]|uniref:hypothetical protein n=1 Tax=Sphingopyxis sp. UBA6734 TaxID=1947539 RepID=UPI0025E0238E|nr:hypothetical protein [Sphingopyxis sp. UBA6734]
MIALPSSSAATSWGATLSAGAVLSCAWTEVADMVNASVDTQTLKAAFETLTIKIFPGYLGF